MTSSSPAEADATADTDPALLDRAAQAELRRASLLQKGGVSEHPSGLVAATEDEPDTAYRGATARRQPRSR